VSETANLEFCPVVRENPYQFSVWLLERRSLGVPDIEIANQLQKVETPVAHLRAARLYGGSGNLDAWCQLARSLAKDDDETLRCAGLIELTLHEMEIVSEANSTVFETLIPSLLVFLERLGKINMRSDLTSETELRILVILANNYVESHQYEQARKYASLAIIGAKELNLDSYRYAAYNIMALAALRLGQLIEAHAEYGVVVSSVRAPEIYRGYAAINQVVITGLMGDDAASLRLFEQFLSVHPSHQSALVSHQYVRAMLGWTSIDEPICRDPSSNYDVQVECIQLLLDHQTSGSAAQLQKILSIMRSWKPNSSIAIPMIKWFQAIAFYRLGLPLMAIKAIMSAESKIPSIEILIQGLKLEISLQFDGIEFELLETTAKRIEQIFSEAPDSQARTGLASKLSFWNPNAAAFCAFSPLSIPEIHEFGAPAVFKDGRPITVYGKGVNTRLPFVQKTLVAFGYDTRVGRDQSVEQERLAKVLLVQNGNRIYQRPIVPPALIAYQLVRCSETAGTIWHRAAIELVQNYGLVPSTMGAYLRDERRELQEALEQLLSRHLSLKNFKEIVIISSRR
jgi:tetratricopeptide (TPR) repeat protein